MELTYGFTPYLRRLGIKPRRPHTYIVTNPAALPAGTVGSYDCRVGEGGDFLVDSIFYERGLGVNDPDMFVGMELLLDGRRLYNRNGAFLTSPAVDFAHFDPFVDNVSKPSPFVLPWIIRSGDVLRFNCFSPFLAPPAGNINIVISGYLLDSVGQESPFIPYVWTLSDQADLAIGAVGVMDQCVISGLSDFLCTSITCKDANGFPAQPVLRSVRIENVDAGGSNLWDRQTFAQGSTFGSQIGHRSEGAFPVPAFVPNNSVVKDIIDNNLGAVVRRPQLCIFGYFVNSQVFPDADLGRGVL